MSVNWLWKDKMGSLVWSENGSHLKVNIYDANCLCALIRTYTDDNRDVYDFYTFFNDITHLKKCIGLAKDYRGLLDNMFKDKWSNIRLNTYFKQSVQIAKWLTKAGFEVTLYYEEV